MSKKKNKSSFDAFGSIGILASILQSSTVKLGTITENLVYRQLLNNGYKNINDFGQPREIKEIIDKKDIKQLGPLVVNDFLKNFDPKEKYVGQKIAFDYEGKRIQADILIYTDEIFYVFEIKSSTSFDTKKSQAEVTSLFENTIALQRLLTHDKNQDLQNCIVKGYVCCLEAQDKQEILKGFKGYVLDNDNMWNDENFDNVMRGQLSVINRKDLIKNSDMSMILKAFVESPINRHTLFTENIIKKYGIYVCTGNELYNTFDLDFSQLQNLREEEAKNILIETIDEKKGKIDEDTINLIKKVHKLFLQNDSQKIQKNNRQINLFD